MLINSKLLIFLMSFKKKLKKLKAIKSFVPKKIKIKANPLNFIDETKDKIGNFYSNLKKEREKDKRRAEKKKILDARKELQRQKKQAQKEKLDQIREEKRPR